MLRTMFHRTIDLMPQWDAAQKARRVQGEPIRRAILDELLRRELKHEPAPTWVELGAAVGGMADTTAGYHCRVLRAAGLVTWEPGLARTIRLTDAGRQFVTAP